MPGFNVSMYLPPEEYLKYEKNKTYYNAVAREAMLKSFKKGDKHGKSKVP